MTTTLSVVNDCLAIMGEAPLNALSEDHAYKQSALTTLDRVDLTIQAKGWWFNVEALTVSTNPTDGRIYLPNDSATIMPLDERPNIVQRGRVLYDLKRGTDIFDLNTTYKIQLKRRVPFEHLPQSISAYIARQTVLEFQMLYDGDSTKTRALYLQVNGDPQLGTLGLRGEAMAEHIRNRRVNLIWQSSRLHQITSKINYSRRPY